MALGATAGDRIAEARDRRENLGHFEQIYQSMPYYRAGYTGTTTRRPTATAWKPTSSTANNVPEAESILQGAWESNAHFGSRMAWLEARPAVEHAWRSLDEALGKAEHMPPR